VVGGYIQQGFLRVVEPDGTVAWEVTAPRVAHGADSFRAARPDAEGNVYAALVAPGLPTGYPPPSDQDVFVRKYTPAGAVVWETALASVGQDDVSALAVTPAGDVFVTGFTGGDLVPGAPPGAFFVARLGPDGAIRWVKQVGIVGAPHGIAVDGLGNLALADGDTLASLDLDGNVRWQRSIGTAAPGGAFGVALDATGAIWVVGTTAVPNITPLIRTDAFVARYDAAGNLLWSKQLGAGAPLSEDLKDIAIDAAGYGVATGSTDAPDPVNGGILSANVVLLRIAPDGTY
jgi:hypothetical protein